MNSRLGCCVTRDYKALTLDFGPPTAELKTEAARRLRMELEALPMSQLRKRSIQAGATEAQMDEAADSGREASALAELIVSYTPTPASAQVQHVELAAAGDLHAKQVAALEAELGGLRLSELQRRAESEGAESEDISKALDSDNPKAELVALIVTLFVQLSDWKGRRTNALSGASHKGTVHQPQPEVTTSPVTTSLGSASR